MIHPEEQPFTEPAGKRSSILMAVILFLTIIVIAVFGYIKSQGIELKNIDVRQFFLGNNNVRQLNETANITEIPYDSKEHPVFGVHQDYIASCSRDGIRLLDKKGQEVWSVGVALDNPLIKTNGKDLLVVDIGGRDVYVINGKNVRWKDKTDENIQNAEISENGYVTVITSSKLYNGEVRVYDNNGIERRQNVIANGFAVTAKTDPSGKLMVIDLINASNAKSYTYLEFYEMDGTERVLKNMSQDKGLYPLVWFLKEDTILAAGGTSIASMDKSGNVKWEKQFSRIYSACITGSKRLAVAVENENVRELKVITIDGQEYSSVQLDEEVLNISALGGIIAINTGHQASFMTERCKSKGVYNSTSDIIEVLFFNKQQVAVVTKSHVAVIDIN